MGAVSNRTARRTDVRPSRGKGGSVTGPSGSLPSHGRTDAPTETGRRGPWARGGGAPPQPVVGSEKARATSRQSQGAPLTPDQLRNVRPVTPDRAPVCRARAAPWSRPSQGLVKEELTRSSVTAVPWRWAGGHHLVGGSARPSVPPTAGKAGGGSSHTWAHALPATAPAWLLASCAESQRFPWKEHGEPCAPGTARGP